MGIFRKKNTTQIETKSDFDKADYKTRLDSIQKEVHQFLKPLGFKKRGRTFNRETENGLYQVINFQSGQYPIGEKYEIPGIRESFYGKFTVNFGVCVEELYLIEFPKKSQPFYQDYDCQIRDRLETILHKTDSWWQIDSDSTKISDMIIDGLKSKGFDWFELFDTREKIIHNWGEYADANSPRAKLDVALIVLQTDKIKGAKLIQDYYNHLEKDRKPHREYVIDLAKRFDIEINEQ